MIAIIAILAAILLPVFATARERARRGSCMSNLHQVSEALTLFHKDTLGYPPSLWDPSNYGTYPNSSLGAVGNGVPAAGLAMLLGYTDANGQKLVPQYLVDPEALHCPNNPVADRTKVSTKTTVGFDNYNGPDEYAMSQSGYDPNITVYTYTLVRLTKMDPSNPANFSAINSEPDFSRQLFLKDPDETTVVTWCTEHRPRVNGIPTPQAGQKDDIFLYLDGHTRVGSFANPNSFGSCKNHDVYGNGLDDPNCQ